MALWQPVLPYKEGANRNPGATTSTVPVTLLAEVAAVTMLTVISGTQLGCVSTTDEMCDPRDQYGRNMQVTGAPHLKSLISLPPQ